VWELHQSCVLNNLKLRVSDVCGIKIVNTDVKAYPNIIFPGTYYKNSLGLVTLIPGLEKFFNRNPQNRLYIPKTLLCLMSSASFRNSYVKTAMRFKIKSSPKVKNTKAGILDLTNALTSYILQAYLNWSCINCSVSKRNKYQEFFLRDKGDRCISTDKLTTFMYQFAWDLGPSNSWKPQVLSWPFPIPVESDDRTQNCWVCFHKDNIKMHHIHSQIKRRELDYTVPG
jgi:hypothetical protein